MTPIRAELQVHQSCVSRKARVLVNSGSGLVACTYKGYCKQLLGLMRRLERLIMKVAIDTHVADMADCHIDVIGIDCGA